MLRIRLKYNTNKLRCEEQNEVVTNIKVRVKHYQQQQKQTKI